MTEGYAGRDRLRELLDAVLDEEHTTLGAMADGAYSSPYHFSRQLTKGAGEPPVAMRRRVMLERAAWQLRHGTSVTDAAFAAGYESVEGFSRAFARAYGHLPSESPRTESHWLPAPNGIHFHPPMSLWVHTGERTMSTPIDLLVHQDLDDTRHLLEAVKGIPDADYRAVLRPGHAILEWEGEEASVAALLMHHVSTKEIWLAAIRGDDFPDRPSDEPASLLERHDAVAARWLEMVREMERRNAWEDRIVDALCDPPESFVLGSILGHVLVYAAHRRQLVRSLLRELGHTVDDGDPISWLRARHGEETSA